MVSLQKKEREQLLVLRCRLHDVTSSMTNSKLIVISGFSGSGKDTVIDILLEKHELSELKLQRLVTHTDREPREGEVHGRDYHFVQPSELSQMHAKRELVEVPVTYGTSRKATSKAEFNKLINQNVNLIWRIDPSLAVSVAKGEFFKKQFNGKKAHELIKKTQTIFVTADYNSLHTRRRTRDGEKYNHLDYKIRDNQDEDFLEENSKYFDLVVENKDGEIENSVQKISKILTA